MPPQRPPKKSETLEIRLPYADKEAFMARCRSQGQTASQALRVFIERDLESKPISRPRNMGWWQAAAAALIGLALGAVAAPSLAHPSADPRATFERLDRNHDGVLTFDEFRAR